MESLNFYHLNNYTEKYNSEILHTFTLRTFDTSLNYSLGATGEIRIQKDNIPPTQVINLTASYSAMENTITVSWENPLDEDFAGVQIAYGKFGEDEINSFFVEDPAACEILLDHDFEGILKEGLLDQNYY